MCVCLNPCVVVSLKDEGDEKEEGEGNDKLGTERGRAWGRRGRLESQKEKKDKEAE